MTSSPRLLLGRLPATAVVPVLIAALIGAADAPEDPVARLRSLSPQQRNEISETLRRFELQLTPEQQKAIRDLDQQVQKLPDEERTHFQAVLRRYHNWLDSLPDTVKDNLQSKPPSERMAQIRTLLAKYPVPPEKTPYWMQFASIAGGSPFELAAVFKIWQGLNPQQRREIEILSTPAQRREKLFEYGHDLKIPREIRPADFRGEEWMTKAEEKILELRETDPELRAIVAKAAGGKLQAQPGGQGQGPVGDPAPPGDQPLLPRQAVSQPGDSRCAHRVLQCPSALDPHHVRFLSRRRSSQAADAGVPAGLPLSGRVPARANLGLPGDRPFGEDSHWLSSRIATGSSSVGVEWGSGKTGADDKTGIPGAWFRAVLTDAEFPHRNHSE